MTNNLDTRIETIREQLASHNQQHLLGFADRLSPTELELLISEIENLDLALIDQLIRRFIHESATESLPKQILPPPVYPVEPPAEMSAKYQLALDFGRRLIADGKVAAFTVAGGMGTRLNFDGPKGLFSASPVKNKTLFQMFAEAIRATQIRYHCQIPWYIMTSSATHQTTVRAFEENDYYRLDPDNIVFFQQGLMPCLDLQGQILLSGSFPGRPRRIPPRPVQIRRPRRYESTPNSIHQLFSGGQSSD